MRIFIIGGTGVLSTDVVKECLRHRDELFILNRGRHKEDIPNDQNIHLIIGDIRDTDGVKEAVRGLLVDVVIDFLSFIPSQLENTYRIFAPLCKQYVFISTCCVYQRKPGDGIIKEDSPKPNLGLSYGYEKYQCELLIEKLNKDYKSKYTIVRPYITYGDTRIPFGITPQERYHWTIIGRIISNKPFFIWDKGENRCSLLHTVDFAKIFYHLLLNEKAFNEDVNITHSISYKWIEVLDIIYDYLNADKRNIIRIPKEYIARKCPEYAESLLGDRALDALFDHTKLSDIVPETETILRKAISLKDGIKKTIESYQNNQYYKGIDISYDARIDRLIASVLPYKEKNKRIRYIDYIGKASRGDRFYYILCRYASNFSFKVINYIKREFL